MAHHLDLMRDAWAGRPLPGGDTLYPVNPGLTDRLWQATFSIELMAQVVAPALGWQPVAAAGVQ